MTTPSAASASAGFFDARPLVEPVDQREVDAFTRASPSADGASTQMIVGWSIFLAVLAVFVLPPVGLIIVGAGYALFDVGGLIAAVVLGILLLAGLITGGVLLIRRSIAARRLARYRLSRFAAANSMTFIDGIPEPPLPGMLFSHGSSRRSTNVLRGVVPRFVEFGNYQYTTSSGKSSQTHHWGYVAVKLDVPLPHIVLDARGDGALGGGLPLGLERDQHLSLEGDFDQHFTLYCPRGYETDALYLFTPDVMVRFIDHVAQFDVEIVDDWLFLYTKRPVSTLDPATWAWIFGAVGALLVKLDQWARWRDDRLRGLGSAPAGSAPLGVAPAGSVPGSVLGSVPAGSVAASSPVPLAPGFTPVPAAPPLPFADPSAALLTPPPPGVAPPGQRLRRQNQWVVALIILAIGLGVGLLPFALGLASVLMQP